LAANGTSAVPYFVKIDSLVQNMLWRVGGDTDCVVIS